MKRKRLDIIVGIVLFLLILYTLLRFGNTPEGAIRRYVFLKINPYDALSLTVSKNYNYTNNGERQYSVKGVIDRESGNSLSFFYLKQDNHGKWYVSSCGSGP